MSNFICNVKIGDKRVNVAYDMSIELNEHTIVSLKDGKNKIGYIAYSECFVDMLSIEKPRIGIGTCLYQFAENEMRKYGCDSIELLAEESGVDFWEKQGFVQKHAWSGDFPIRMIKQLD